LELLKNALLVFLLVFQLRYFLDVVALFQLSAHAVDFFFVVLNSVLTVSQFLLLFNNGWVIRELTEILEHLSWNLHGVGAFTTCRLTVEL
jgi:hypothetical protein